VEEEVQGELAEEEDRTGGKKAEFKTDSQITTVTE
jgi:hypothetical protein